MSNMTTLSFKAPIELKRKLEILAKQKGINLSAFLKMLLTESLDNRLDKVTENGMTVREELEMLYSEMFEESVGPFETAEEFMKSLESDEE